MIFFLFLKKGFWGYKMKETHITIYIHDLEISDKSKSFLARVGLMKLDDLLNCNMTELSAIRNISEDVLQELNGVIAHSDVIISFFEERAKRIKEILPNVQDAPIESLGLGTRATNALRRGGIHTVGALIQMSQKDIFELRNVGVLSREEITKAIESIVQSGKIVYHEREEESKTIIETAPESSRLSELLPEIESIRLDDVPFSVRARNALKRANIQTADELVQMSEKDIMGLRNVGAQTRDEILAVINAIEFDSLEQSDNGLAFTMPFDGEHDTVRIQVINLANERLMFDRTFVLISEADCCFNREFYYNASDYDGAEFYADIDDFHEVVPFGKDEAEVRIPFRDGELHADIPKITVSETSGAWLQEPQPAWYIGHIPQNSFLKVTTPARVNIQFLVGGKDILYDGQGLVTIGNVLQSFGGTDSFNDAEVVMRVAGQTQSASYSLARVFFKERFLKRPSLWTEEQKLLWDQGGVFIGTSGREFTLLLSSADDKLFEFKLSEDTEYIILPEDMPIGNYQFEISIQTGGLFKRAKEVVAVGDCIIGDKNLLRFMNRRIVVESITDEFKEEAGHILIRPCYIDQIQYCGMEDTSEGYCPVYSGILYTTGYHGERYEFSYDVHTNKKGITKMLVNPVRIVYISNTALCITDPDGDGLYYYNYYDRSLESVVFALTDHEYTKANKQKYSNADLYSYRTERV